MNGRTRSYLSLMVGCALVWRRWGFAPALVIWFVVGAVLDRMKPTRRHD